MTSPGLLSIGTATPEGRVPQAEAAELAVAVQPTPDHDRAIRALYARAGILARATALGAPDELRAFFRAGLAHGPSTAKRAAAYREHAGPLAARAARQALERADLAPQAVTHLITVSCTGFDAPGADQHLIRELGLKPTVRRTNIGFMGCHAAINALAVAAAFARADADARVLVCCVELCTLHFSYHTATDRLVANALFADGAAAAVVAATSLDSPRLHHFASVILPDSRDQMAWSIGDHGFEMSLSPLVPETLARAVPPWTKAWLDQTGLATRDIARWAIHPGGPRVLSALRDALELPHDAVDTSRAILAAHGNMSSATVLFIIEQMLADPDRATLPLVAMAFGPGLAGEAHLLTAPA